jgi:hypothetical protein
VRTTRCGNVAHFVQVLDMPNRDLPTTGSRWRALTLLSAVLVSGCTDRPAASPTSVDAASDVPTAAAALVAVDPAQDSTAAHGTDSHATHLWRAGANDSCTEAVHNQYSVIAPDGKRYPRWHPPVDPATGCRFGHEHGRDPRGSALFAEIGWDPFGYGAERLMVWQPTGMRHEDHVGHKIEWENNVQLHYSQNGQRVPFDVRCSWLTKFHQGTHSPDAPTNNTHELNYHVRCTDGTSIDAIVMSRLGPVGSFERACEKGRRVASGIAPQPGQVNGRGTRLIPDRACVLRHILVASGHWSGYSGALYENWSTANYLRTADGREIAYFDPGFAVFNPSRYHDPAQPTRTQRTIDACYEQIGSGAAQRRARGGECDWGTNGGSLRLAWDDPRSPFTGTKREVYFNQTTLSNRGGPTVWYTDPFGGNASVTPFRGAIRQRLAALTNRRPWPLESQAVGANRPYGGSGVHAPN